MHLPYRVHTEFGEQLEFSFPLHEQTDDPVRVAQLVESLLGTLDREMTLAPGTANGDVLQAVAIALAIRARLVPAPSDLARELVGDLMQSALSAALSADGGFSVVGHA